MANTVIEHLDNPFWQFSLRIYQNEKVKKACLLLQDQQGVNVNLLLLCCWLSYAVGEVSLSEFHQACHSINHWQKQVTQPLRQVRQYLKNSSPNHWVSDFYQQILATELASESFQQSILYSHFVGKQKNNCAFNEKRLLCYLTWLFESMTLSINTDLRLKIHYFIKQVQEILK